MNELYGYQAIAAGESDLQTSRAAGANAFLPKLIQAEALLKILQQHPFAEQI